MKSLLFLAVIGLLFVGCSDDNTTAVEEKEVELIDVSQQTDDDVVVTADFREDYQTYLDDVTSLELYSEMLEVSSTDVMYEIGDTLIVDIDEASAKNVITKLGYDFYIDKNEVSQKDYFAIMGDSTKYPPSYGTDGSWKSSTQPVGNVSLFNALTFCNKRSELKGLDAVYTISGDKNAFTVAIDYSKNGYALPTSAEWEYVAKNIIIAGDTTDAYKSTKYVVTNGSEPVTSKELEAYNGLTAFFGNVREICLSNSYYYKDNSDALSNPGIKVFSSTDDDKFVVMGGSYKTGSSKVHPSNRDNIKVYTTVEDAGIRCVIRMGTVDPESELVIETVVDTSVITDSLTVE